MLNTGERVGPYEILGLIGSGGMGEVYCARDTRLNRDVAVKVLPDLFAQDAERLARFEREAQILASLNHPHIAHLHGLEESGRVRALVMELVHGETLAEKIARGPMPVDEALPIAQHIAEALESAHDQGIVHRDLKPANIKVTPSGAVKLLDFGLAKAFGTSGDVSESPTVTSVGTRAGVVLGTVAYMSPEQARGSLVDKRTDIWAFGCVLYEMLAGRAAFAGATLSDTLARILERDADWGALPAATPASLRRLLRRCLEKDPKRRLRDVGDARAELGEAVAPGEPVAPRAVWRWVAATAVFTAAVAGIVLWTPNPSEVSSISRFSYVLPEGQAYTNEGFPLVAISPDGKAIVYVANDRLHLRSMDALESRPIRGTEGSPSTPFFSPDGQSIAYVDGDQGRTRLRLKRIAASGGTPVPLSNVTSFLGASWAPDDTIVFGQNDGIWRVSAQGGTPERVVAVEPHERAASPQLLPGGRALLFTLTSGVGEARWDDDARIVVQSLDTGDRQVVWTGGSSARYVSTGHLVFALRTVLFAVPFDPAGRQVRGRPVPVVESVHRGVLFPGSIAAANFDFSSQGVLVYLPAAPRPLVPRQLLAVDRQGNPEPLVDDLRDYWRPRVSPDGRRLAVEVRDSTGVHIWIVDLPKRTAAPLTFEGATNWSPVWSPDAKSVIFNSDRGGFFGFYRQPIDGSSEAELLWRSNKELLPTDSSRDGILAFTEGGQTAERAIWTLRLDDLTGSEFLSTPSMEHMPMFSPDGKWLAYASNESGRPEVYVRPYPRREGGLRRLSEGGGTAPVWSPDGSALYYLDAAGMLMTVAIRLEPLFSFDRPQPLFQFTGNFRVSGNTSAYDVSVSRDGTRLIVVSQTETFPAPRQFNIVINWFEELKRVTSSN